MGWDISNQGQAAATGSAIHRFLQVSNGVNSTLTISNILTTNILPLLGTGLFNDGYNNPLGFGSFDPLNNWIDVRNINRNANMICRATLTNNGVGTVVGATLVMRLIPDISTPAIFTDIINVPESFGSQAAFMIMAFHGGTDAIQIGIRTSQVENIRLNGVYLAITDISS